VQVVSIINHKGGVGKTTLTANLGAGLAARGKRVLLLDLDSQASLTVSFFTPPEWAADLLPARTVKHWFDGLDTGGALQSPAGLISTPRRVREKLARSTGRLDLIAAHRDLSDVDTTLAAQLMHDEAGFTLLHSRLRAALRHEAFSGYDIALIDCAPNFGLVARNAVAASDMLLIPTKPDYLSTNGIDSLGLKIAEFVEEFNARCGDEEQIAVPPAAVVFTMVQLHNDEPIEAQRSVMSRVAAGGVTPLTTTIRDSKAVYGPAPEYGVPVILGGTGRAQTRELREFVSEVWSHLDDGAVAAA
jgi:chromosome partitioning protein